MGVFRRSFISIQKNLGKTILLLMLIFVLCSAISAAISIHIGIANVETNLRRKMPTIVTLDYLPEHALDTWTLHEWDFEDRFNFTREIILPIGSLSHVAFFEYSQTVYVHSLHIRQYMSEFVRDAMVGQGHVFTPPGEGWCFSLLLRGFSQPEIVYIEIGELEFVAGRSFTQEEIDLGNNSRSSVAVISRQFANYNHVWIGDVMTFSSMIQEAREAGETWRDDITIEYEFEVIGIWDYVDRPMYNSESNSDLQDGFMNKIFVPNWIVNQIEMDWHHNQPCRDGNEYFWCQERSLFGIWPHFVLTDPAYLDDFRNVATDMLPQGFFLEDYSNRFATINHSTNMLLDVANMLMYGAIASAIGVLSLTLIFFLHDRRYEIGIYLSLGEKRSKVLIQLLIEVLVVAILGITLALLVGNIVSNHLSQTMLRNEVLAFESERPWWEAFPEGIEIAFGYQQLSYEDMLEAFDTSLSIGAVALFYAIGLVIALTSTLLPIWYILRLEPKKMLL